MHSRDNEIRYLEAMVEFGYQFSDYVKNVDEELWKRAVEYAKDYTKKNGIVFTDKKTED
tara:strand:- start:3680 stop:3856 length:177 start_codon:yes stop_codon:yes gene_type:complete